MSDKKKLVIVISRGFDDERASVAWSIANGGIKTGLDVSIFLVSSGIDWVRKGAMEGAHLNPYDPPMKDMIQFVIDSGGTIMACPPCAKARGYGEAELLDGVVITGSGAMHELIKQGAATLSF
ncbi:MAG: DsrE family protein [Calditrichaeota bacterium]|nr:DsrE family protein [Calditrichota bacterium]MCB0291133.1 DsrE family protein [Calditrichota bacterium]MCB0305153.1 DsrE family protein [Calditrichota bacterium]MCB9086984.1 DsrE family protein [Calditrichia bacterium]